ncbi:hypothetical protein [Microbacterium sp. NPDC080220]|uniref:hypothetical protein n=1 Tax=Microbacterium sp. NPDC080220 TaxID=3161017 RepID=UPI003416AD24
MRAHWSGLEFNGGNGPARFTIEEFTGLYDGVSPRGERSERPTGDGEFDSLMYLSARSGSITGLLHATSPTDYERSLQQLAAIPFRVSTTLTAQTELGSRWIKARRSEAPNVQHLVYGRTARFMVQWLAQDPRWYGEAREFTGNTVDVYQRGSFESFPVVEVTGSRPSGYTVSSQGHSFVVTRSVSSGETHRIDMRTGWLYVNGVLQGTGVASADVFAIPPGRTVSVSVSGGSGSMKVKPTDTFV